MRSRSAPWSGNFTPRHCGRGGADSRPGASGPAQGAATCSGATGGPQPPRPPPPGRLSPAAAAGLLSLSKMARRAMTSLPRPQARAGAGPPGGCPEGGLRAAAGAAASGLEAWRCPEGPARGCCWPSAPPGSFAGRETARARLAHPGLPSPEGILPPAGSLLAHPAPEPGGRCPPLTAARSAWVPSASAPPSADDLGEVLLQGNVAQPSFIRGCVFCGLRRDCSFVGFMCPKS